MATVYSEIPHNWSDIQNYVITDKEEIVGASFIIGGTERQSLCADYGTQIVYCLIVR